MFGELDTGQPQTGLFNQKSMVDLMEITPELAEFLGILIGDGYLDKTRGRVIISGNLQRDTIYLEKYVKVLIENLFDVKCISWKQIHKNCFYLAFYSRKIVDELIAMNLSKTEIPQIILSKNKEIKQAFMRGLADTDFGLYFASTWGKKRSYPHISTTFSNEKFVFQIKSLLTEFGIGVTINPSVRKYATKIYKQWDIHINGKKNLELWLNNIGFSNPRILNRLAMWKEKGFCNVY